MDGRCFQNGVQIPCQVYEVGYGRYTAVGDRIGYVFDLAYPNAIFFHFKLRPSFGPYLLYEPEVLSKPGEEPTGDWVADPKVFFDPILGIEFYGIDKKRYKIVVDR